MTKIINIFAGPSAGKSTAAAGLFHYMKDKRLNVELAAEFAKDVVWSNDKTALADQFYLFGQQHHRIYKLLNQVDWIITDCPLLLSTVYMDDPSTLSKYENKGLQIISNFQSLVYYTHVQYVNYNYFIERGSREFIQAGRVQNYEKSIEKDNQIKQMLDGFGIQFRSINSFLDIIVDLGFRT